MKLQNADQLQVLRCKVNDKFPILGCSRSTLKTMAFGQLSASLPTEVYVHNQSETVSSVASKSYKTLTNKENESIGHRF